MSCNNTRSHCIGIVAAGPIIECATIGPAFWKFANHKWLRAAEVNTADTVYQTKDQTYKMCLSFSQLGMVPARGLFVWTGKDLAILLRLARWQKCEIFYLLRLLLYVCFAALTISFFYVRIALLVAAAASRNELSLIWGLIVVLLGNNGHRLHTYIPSISGQKSGGNNYVSMKAST